MKQILIIGTGNLLRGDDGAGIRAVQEIARRYPAMECITAHGLMPEMAERIIRADLVLFVDASVRTPDVRVSHLSGEGASPLEDAHGFTPAGLLSFAGKVYGQRVPDAVLFEIPVVSTDLNDRLSAGAEASVREVISRIDVLLAAGGCQGRFPKAAVEK